MARIFITGATGFLGSHLAAGLTAAGHAVLASVRRRSDTRWIDPLPLETVELDLAGSPHAGGSGPEVAALQGVDAVVHCAGLTRARDEAEFQRVNADGTERLVRAAVEAGVRRFVLISSLAARGPDGAGGPVSPYGRSKREGERRLEAQAGRIDAAILRPGGIYGPRDADLLPLFRLARRGWVPIPASAAPLQPVYVSDVVSATLAALETPDLATPLPVAGAERRTWPALAGSLSRAVERAGRVVRVPPAAFWAVGLVSEVASRITGDAPAMDRRRARDLAHYSWTCEIGGTREALGWNPEVGIDEGLALTASWYRELGWLRAG